MPIAKQETPTVDEKLWNAWLHKNKQREYRSAERMKRFAGAVLSVTFLAAAALFLAK
ncbi:MAG: hypothetical protein JNL62_11385 [Bryobacterales bacterium]|nr:hypothetical protein [Bryobacterales bacterium]